MKKWKIKVKAIVNAHYTIHAATEAAALNNYFDMLDDYSNAEVDENSYRDEEFVSIKECV